MTKIITNKTIPTEDMAIETVETKEPSIDMGNILKMLEEQRKTIEGLQEQIKKQGATQKSTPVTKPTEEKTSISYDPNRIVAVVCMYDGESLTLKTGHQGETASFYGYGDKQYFRYEVAANMARMNRSFATKGSFVFEDSDLIRDFGLEKSYDSFINKNVLDKLETLDSASLVALYSRSNDAYRGMIVDKFINGYVEGNSEYRQVDKIDALSKASDKDIQYTIDEIQKAKRMNK